MATPKTNDSSDRDAMKAPANPAAAPTTTGKDAPATVVSNSRARGAPSARRIAVSCSRDATKNLVVPYTAAVATTIPSAPNASVINALKRLVLARLRKLSSRNTTGAGWTLAVVLRTTSRTLAIDRRLPDCDRARSCRNSWPPPVVPGRPRYTPPAAQARQDRSVRRTSLPQRCEWVR